VFLHDLLHPGRGKEFLGKPADSGVPQHLAQQIATVVSETAA